jgi:hypothetical protein
MPISYYRHPMLIVSRRHRDGVHSNSYCDATLKKVTCGLQCAFRVTKEESVSRCAVPTTIE